jgi:hypothetical protein
MDAGVSSVVSNGVQGFSVSALSQLAEIIPIALAVMVTITLVYYSIHWFMKLAGLGSFDPRDYDMDDLIDWQQRGVTSDGEDESDLDWEVRVFGSHMSPDWEDEFETDLGAYHDQDYWTENYMDQFEMDVADAHENMESIYTYHSPEWWTDSDEEYWGKAGDLLDEIHAEEE